jgi:elongation factor P
MSLTENLRKGMVIRHEDQLFTVLDFNVAQTGKQKPTVHVKLRALKSGHAVERSLDQLGKIEEVLAELRTMQYLYAAGNDRVFMDTQSYEQYVLGHEIVGGFEPFLAEEETYRVLMIEEQVLSLQLPDVVVLTVAETAPVEHAGGSSSVQKDARFNSGLAIKVPLFIKTGDRIRVSTRSREYLGKDH